MIDVCLILEGTYPFVSGGVSTWIHQLISSMSELHFSIVYISPFPNPNREYKYKLPSNLVDLQDLYLHRYDHPPGGLPRRARRKAVESLTSVHRRLLEGRWEAFEEALPLLRAEGGLSFDDMFRSEETWQAMTEFYGRHAGEASFLDFFWTWRSIYLPLYQTLRCPLPRARLYHTVSTGYAGILAAIAKAEMRRPMLLTEHGVYTHERLLEISQASWIYSPQSEHFRVQRELSFFKRFWLGFFDFMGRTTYHYADRIVTLYEGNRTKEIASGAPPEKISIIPNGIDLEVYRDAAVGRPAARARTVAFVGRLVPIKDVKNFLYAAKIIRDASPDTEFVVLGPTDEEPEYAQECRELARNLGFGESLKFLGKVDMREHYPKIDLLILTSLSEAQPYVILEANAVGIPVVATDVGACREMLEGRLADDRRIGASGLVTEVSRPEQTAAAALKILRDASLWTAMSEAGRQRTLRFYDQGDLISQYLNLYERMMN